MKNNLNERIKFGIKRLLEGQPSLYIGAALVINNLKGHNTTRIVSHSTDLCIEGFPRCANSFAVQAIRKYTNESLNIATHLHSHTNVIKAVKMKKPTIVVIRKPDDCIISLRALIIEDSERKQTIPKLVPIASEIKWYISFYKSLLKYRKEVVIADFNEVTNDFNSIILKYNTKFNKSYSVDMNLTELKSTIFSEQSFHLSPSPRRNEIKNLVIKDYQRTELEGLRYEANLIYSQFIQD